jgi:protease-4
MEEQKKKKLSAGAIAGIVIGSLLVVIFFSSCSFGIGLFLGSSANSGGFSTSDAIYQIDFEGQIIGTQTSSLLGVSGVTVESFVSELENAEKNPHVKVILIRMDSPGGVAGASQEMYSELKKVQKPVIVSVSNLCASGAYYVSCAADLIIANKTSEIGSIGVIMQVPNLEELYNKLGIKYTTIKQGKYKDIGSSDRDLTEEEKKLLEAQTRQIYEIFIKDVSEGRKIDAEKVREIATGWVYLGDEALKLGLIDEIGTYTDAVKKAAEIGGIKGEPRIIKSAGQSIFDLFSSLSNVLLNLNKLGDKLGELNKLLDNNSQNNLFK